MNFIPIRAYDNYVEANLTRSMLEDSNIVCYLKDEYTLTIDPLLNIALGGMKLMVNSVQYERAGEILQLADAKYLSTFSCPNCGESAIQKISQTIRYTHLRHKLKSMLINGTTQKERTFYRCSHCQQEFATLPSQEY